MKTVFTFLPNMLVLVQQVNCVQQLNGILIVAENVQLINLDKNTTDQQLNMTIKPCTNGAAVTIHDFAYFLTSGNLVL